MCGIAGVVGRADPTVVDRMLRSLTHRGPDDHFVVSGEEFTLGARRLAIIDVEGGRQPLSNETATVWCCQNGELYNFRELRSALEAEGHVFRTRCDTEILPHLYEAHGEGFAACLRGMFAVALWDDEKKRAVFARDHSGKKPLYYAEHQGALYFASEIKALLRVPGLARELDREAIHHFLSYKHVPAPLTAFRGIRELTPASVLTWSRNQGPRAERFWKPSWAPRAEWNDADERALSERILEVLTEAVSDRLVSDVPVGFYLSGGVDSSLSTAIAASLSSGPILTFTLAYDEEATTPGKESDRAWARAIAERYGTEHHEEVVRIEDFASEFSRIQKCFDQPFSGVTSSYFLSRLIARHVKVALSGDGADELFGSYLSHRLAAPIAAYAEGGSEAAIPEDVRPLFDDNQELVSRIASTDPARWRSKLFVLDEEEKRSLYHPDFLAGEELPSSEAHFAHYFDEPTAEDPLNAILEAEFRGFFPDQVLRFVDRLSMAHSLETRTAYLDPRFIELAASIPGRLKIRGREVKRVLKLAALKYLPEELVRRPKEGFVMPVHSWFLKGLGGFLDRVLAPERIRASSILREERVEELLRRYRGGEHRLQNQILSILALQLWWESYLGPEREI